MPFNIENNFNIDACYEDVLQDSRKICVTSILNFLSSKWIDECYYVRATGHFISMYAKKGIFERLSIDEIILRIYETGIINFWRSMSIS